MLWDGGQEGGCGNCIRGGWLLKNSPSVSLILVPISDTFEEYAGDGRTHL